MFKGDVRRLATKTERTGLSIPQKHAFIALGVYDAPDEAGPGHYLTSSRITRVE